MRMGFGGNPAHITLGVIIMKQPSATKKGSGRYHKQGHKKNKPAKK
tara:strand:- start:613 stop:750 length:138 start_codon:yes stop_codon:yes gene_type:complete